MQQALAESVFFVLVFQSLEGRIKWVKSEKLEINRIGFVEDDDAPP